MENNEKTSSKRTRAFAPKVRTGCLTCKKRRKKCDEEKPTCRRCSDGGYVCDGYTPAPITAPPDRPESAIVQASAPVPYRALLPGDWLGVHFYNHFFGQTVHDMAISRSLNSDFWRSSFMGPSQDARCIWHATVALGAVHWMFITPSAEHDPSLTRFATIQYNGAISELMQITQRAEESPTNSSTILTCCFLFVLLESLRGNFSEAMRHLNSGARIITSTPISMSSSTAVRQLAASFHAITSQLSLFLETRIFPDLTGFMVPMKKYKDSGTKLRDLDEAEDALNSLDDVLASMVYDDCTCEPISKSECAAQWAVLREKVRTWSTGFDCLLKQVPRRDQDSHTKKILNLKVQQRMWEIVVGDDDDDDDFCDADCSDVDCGEGPPTPKITTAECNEILDKVEILWKDAVRPRFGLKADLITAAYQLYVFCPDVSVRHRIIALLRSRRRREIMWDSFDMAMFLEEDMAQREMGFQKPAWPDIGPSPSQDALLVFRPAPSL
ncbi:hypothetical protein B0I35DRAFT_158111 [Stachybotrys elegans]|uniref:Zn(2)-C6 fungal-type domain-containing protein n=1 Tax=Stachybotrys elegans TaxID=80388 RepID=A0A8K0T246_9HYPO|nr:hypothetical protein B0I35DRAFT_158111 [Stachybotrys elegans]